MLNRGASSPAGDDPQAPRKWRLDRATGEWTLATAEAEATVEILPPPPPPVQVVVSTTNANGPGVGYYSPPLFSLDAPVAAAAPPLARRPARPQWDPRQLLHPDVLLPLVGAVIVLILFVAWAT
ncbi:MAG TPA: hypothetical protein VHC63_16905 [Acidimicrobiales bacterium]|nr:hypothetical protein [Acidimicrobiales bacterium]